MKEHLNNDLFPQKEILLNYRWNFLVNTLDGASFWFGMSFISSTIILPMYVSHFTYDPFLIGLIPFINSAGCLLPQLFVANFVERSTLKKFFPVNLGLFLERMPILLLAPTAYFLAIRLPTLALLSFFLMYTWHCVGAGVIMVGWQDMIAKIMPVDKRGKFFGVTSFFGNLAGVLGALAVPSLLTRFAFPLGYVYSFTAAAFLILLSWGFLSLTREPPVANSGQQVSQWQYLRSLPQILRSDNNFRKYLFSQISFSLSGMGIGFLIVYSIQTWNLSDSQVSYYIIALQIGLALANLFFGFLSDRKGHKLSFEIAMLLSIISLFLAIWVPTSVWFFVIFFLRGTVNAGTFISGSAIVYEFVDAKNRPTYIGLANTIPGVAGAIAPLIGSLLVSVVGYRAMFLLSAALGIISWGMLHFGVQEPRYIMLNSSGD